MTPRCCSFYDRPLTCRESTFFSFTVFSLINLTGLFLRTRKIVCWEKSLCWPLTSALSHFISSSSPTFIACLGIRVLCNSIFSESLGDDLWPSIQFNFSDFVKQSKSYQSNFVLFPIRNLKNSIFGNGPSLTFDLSPVKFDSFINLKNENLF